MPIKKNIRLKGYDYSQSGSYFINICTRHRRCFLGHVKDGCMYPSAIGRLVDECWMAIPKHFANVRLGEFQLMPNHIHGVIDILDHKSTTLEDSSAIMMKYKPVHSQISPKAGSLSTIVRSFKAAVTKEVHELFPMFHGSVWQSRFYDHIIRNDISRYFIERYIELNPYLWYLDYDNPGVNHPTSGALRIELEGRFGLNDPAVDYLLKIADQYYNWSNEQLE